MLYFIVSNEDGSVVIQAESEARAMQLAEKFELEWDTIEETMIIFSDEE
jgi:hypothetical protein